MTAMAKVRASIGIKIRSASSNVSNMTTFSATITTTMRGRANFIVGSSERYLSSTRNRTGGMNYHHHQHFYYHSTPILYREHYRHQRHMHTVAGRLASVSSARSFGSGGGGVNGNSNISSRQRQRQRQLQHSYPIPLDLSTRLCASRSPVVPTQASWGRKYCRHAGAGRVRFQSSSAASSTVHRRGREEDLEQYQQRVKQQDIQKETQPLDKTDIDIDIEIKPVPATAKSTPTTTATATTTLKEPEPEQEPKPEEPVHGATTNDNNSDSIAPSPSPSSSPSPSLHHFDVNQHHNDLASFLHHARRTGLSPSSTVYTGTCYEYLAQKTLQRYGFELSRVGGRGDRGVDLVGIWRLDSKENTGTDTINTPTTATDSRSTPTNTTPISFNVLVQCKRLTGKHAKIGPNLIRELDGAVRAARHSYSSLIINPDSGSVSNSVPTFGPKGPKSTLGVLVGTRPATKGVVESMRRSNRGLVWVMMEEIGLEQDQQQNLDGGGGGEESTNTPSVRGIIKQILWNQAARDLGLEGVDVVKRILPGGGDEVVLMRS